MSSDSKYRARNVVREIVALYHLSTGLAGLWATIDYAPAVVSRMSPPLRLRGMLFFAGVAIVFLLVALAGVLLLRSSSFAKFLTSVVQIAQIPLWGWGNTMYVFAAGMYAGVIGASGQVRPFLGWKTSLQLSWAGEKLYYFAGVNAAPLIVLCLTYYALAYKDKTSNEPAMTAAR